MNTVFTLWKRGLKAFVRNRTGLIFSILTPFFFIYVFGAIFKNEFIENPVAYMLSGVIIVNVFESALTISSSTVDDMVGGFMKEVLVSPVKRVSVAAGQILTATTVSTLQGILILFIGMFIGIKFTTFLTPLYVILTMISVGLIFSGVGLFLATKVKSGQTFQIVKTAIVLPLTFISGAYLPLSILPNGLKYIAYINPMTYATAFFRMVVLEKTNLSLQQLAQEGLAIDINGFIVTPFMSFAIIIGIGLIFLTLSTLSFMNTDFSKINRSSNDGKDLFG